MTVNREGDKFTVVADARDINSLLADIFVLCGDDPGPEYKRIVREKAARYGQQLSDAGFYDKKTPS